MSDMSVQEKIEHYQRSLLKNPSNEERVVHCLKRLKQLPVTVKHLQTTGVGRTVNALRKFPGDCGNLARHLVEEWKQMVSENRSDDEDEACVPDAPEAYKEESSPSPSRLSLDEEKFVINGDDIHDLQTQQDQNEEEEFQQGEFEEKLNSEPEKDEEEKSSAVSSSESRKSKEKKHSEKERRESKSKSHSKDKESSRKRKREEEDERSKKHKSESKEKSSSSKEKSSSGKEKSSVKDEESRKKDKHKDEKKHRSEGKKSSEEKHKSKKHLSSEDEKEKEKDKKKSKHREESGKHRKSEKSSSRSKNEGSSDGAEKKEKKRDESKKSEKSKLVDPGAGIDCNSGTSFADALGMCSSIPKKRSSNQSAKSSKSETSMFAKPSTSSYQSVRRDEVNNAISRLMSNEAETYEPLSVDLSATLPEISPNYRPLPNLASKNIQALRQEEERLLGEALNKKVMQRSRMYSGKNKGVHYQTVPTLFDLCIQSLIENIDFIDYVGAIPYFILKPVLRLATPEQLFKIEHYNPQLLPDTEELWEYHCNKNFKKYCSTRRNDEMWREMYMRCIEEREARLKGLTEGIKRKIEQAQPVRTAKLAYVDNPVKPPRNVLKNQLKFRTGVEPTGNNEAKRKIIMQSTTGSTNIKVPGSLKKAASSSVPSAAVAKKQKAPLMMKALQLMKQRYKR